MKSLDTDKIDTIVLSIQEYHKQNNSFPKKEMAQLFQLIFPMVEKIVKYKMSRTNCKYNKDDFTQSCYLGLCSAVKKFDSSKSNFAKYAKSWFFAYVGEENKKICSHFKYTSRIDRKIFGKIAELSHLPIEEQAQRLNVSVEDLHFFIQSAKIPATIIKSKSRDGEDETEEYIESNAHLNPEKFFEFKSLHDTIVRCISELNSELKTDREKDILTLLCKVGNPERGYIRNPNTSEVENYIDLAHRHNVSRERIRQIAVAIKEKLKSKLEQNGVDNNIYSSIG